PRHTDRAAAADEDAAGAFGQPEERRLVGDADMRGRRWLKSAAERRAVQRRDEGNVAPRHRLEIAVAVELERQPLGAAGLPAFRRPAQIKPGAEIVPVAEDDTAFGLFTGALDGDAQPFHHVRVEAVALVRPVEADQGYLTLQLVGDDVFF